MYINNNLSNNYTKKLNYFKVPYKIEDGLKIKLFCMKYYFKINY